MMTVSLSVMLMPQEGIQWVSVVPGEEARTRSSETLSRVQLRSWYLARQDPLRRECRIIVCAVEYVQLLTLFCQIDDNGNRRGRRVLSHRLWGVIAPAVERPSCRPNASLIIHFLLSSKVKFIAAIDIFLSSLAFPRHLAHEACRIVDAN